MNPDAAQLSRRAAERAVEFVESAMVVGLGHGSTAAFAIARIAELLKNGRLRDILGVPCSSQVEKEARRLDIPLTTLEDHPSIDLTIDGADEVDPQLNLIKGGGGALLREKVVAQSSRREIIVVDESKLSPALGTRRQVPVEVVPFGWRSQVEYLESLGARVTVREAAAGEHFKSDQGNMILDCNFGRISEPAQLAAKLEQRAGIVEHGLFIGLASDVIVGDKQGTRHLRNQDTIED